MYDCEEEHDSYLRVTSISSYRLLSSQQNSKTENTKVSQAEIGVEGYHILFVTFIVLSNRRFVNFNLQ